jgi:hypothetical protein
MEVSGKYHFHITKKIPTFVDFLIFRNMPRIHVTELDKLKQEIEEKLNLSGQKVGYTARTIDELYPNGVSRPQLNRIWADDTTSKGKDDFRQMTDNVINDLVGILGYKNWREYKEHLNTEIIKQNPVGVFYDVNIDISRLRDGEEITIGYTKKYAKLRYIEGFEFEVLENHNTQKKKGERFITPGFSVKISASGEPDIMLDDYGDGYFDYQREEFGEVFDDDYFYL